MKSKKKVTNGMPMPVNTKSMFSMLCGYMHDLNNGSVTSAKAHAMSRLVGQAHNILNYELKRGLLMSNPEFQKHYRELELKPFNDCNSNNTLSK